MSNSKEARRCRAASPIRLPLSRLIRNLLYVIIDRRRTDILNDIADAFEMALDERLGIVRADVKSAAPLNDRQQSDLQQELSRRLGQAGPVRLLD